MIKKMWQRLLGSLLAIILIVPFSFTVAKADPNTPVVYTNSYGSFTQSWYSDGSNAYNDVVINLKDNYSGTITINWTYNANNAGNNISQWNYLVYGGYISSTANNKLTIKIVNSNCVEIHMNTLKSTSTNQSWIGWQFAFSSWSFSGSEYVDPLETTANSIDGKLTTMNSTLNTIKNTLSTLASSIQGSNGTTLDDLLEQLQDMDDLFIVGSGTNNYETIAEIVYQMRSRLTEFTNSWGFDQTNDFYTTMNTIKNDIESVITVANGILSSLNTISSQLNNIDNTIDTVTWRDATAGTGFQGYSNDGINKQQISSNIAVPYETSVYFHFTTNGYSAQSLYRFIIPFSYGNMSFRYVKPQIEAFLLSGNTLIPVKNYELFSYTMAYRTYIYYEGASFSSSDLVFKVTTPNSGYIYNGISDVGYKYIYSTDIEYWTIKSALIERDYYSSQKIINQTIVDKLNDIIDAIGNVSVTTTEINNVTYNFDTNIETINNIHNTYNQQFNEVKNNVNNYDFTINNDMNSSKVGINDLFTRFYNIEFFRIPILVIMACAIFLIVLG